MSYKNGSKLEVLKAVRDNKELLFGPFSDTLTKNDKVQKWMEIHDHAKALGLVPHTKDYKYTRDVFWQNIRKNTMKKVDNKRQTGSEGGPSFKYTEIDNVVLDIMGKESPSVIGLPVAETWGNDLNQKSTAVNQKTTSTHPEEDSLMPTNDSDDFVKECTGTKRYAKKEDSFQELKIKKLKLSVELMEKDSYLKSLEILKLERELSLPPSQYTAQFCNETLYYYEANNNTEEVVIENVNNCK